MPKKEAERIDLNTILGIGEKFHVGDREYNVKPLKLKDVQEFVKSSVSFGAQLFNLVNDEAEANLNKWLSKQVTDESGEPMTVERATEQDWDLVDLKRCVQKIIDVSG